MCWIRCQCTETRLNIIADLIGFHGWGFRNESISTSIPAFYAIFCNAHSTHGTRWMNKSLCIIRRTIYLQINPSMTLHPIIALAFDWITTKWANSVSASRSKHYYLWILWFTDVYAQIITYVTTTVYCVCRAHSCSRRAFSSRQRKLLLNELVDAMDGGAPHAATIFQFI